MFQPQNIIANPDVLFFKADTMEHRQKLQTIFPYVLGVLTPEILAKRYRLDELRKLERRFSRELESLRESSDRWLAELHIALTRARELGLVSATNLTPVAAGPSHSTLAHGGQPRVWRQFRSFNSEVVAPIARNHP